MKPQDTIAITLGTVTGTALADSLEQILASAAAAIAVYLVKAAFDFLKRKIGGE